MLSFKLYGKLLPRSYSVWFESKSKQTETGKQQGSDIAFQGNGVSRHHSGPIEGPQKTPVHHSTIVLGDLRGPLIGPPFCWETPIPGRNWNIVLLFSADFWTKNCMIFFYLINFFFRLDIIVFEFLSFFFKLRTVLMGTKTSKQVSTLADVFYCIIGLKIYYWNIFINKSIRCDFENSEWHLEKNWA